MKNEEFTQVYNIANDLFFDEFEEDFDENWLVSGVDIFKDFDELKIESTT